MTPSDPVPTRYGIDRPALGAMLTEWGEPRYRADQVWDALYRQRIPLEAASNLGKGLRDRLIAALPLVLESGVERRLRLLEERHVSEPGRPCRLEGQLPRRGVEGGRDAEQDLLGLERGIVPLRERVVPCGDDVSEDRRLCFEW